MPRIRPAKPVSFDPDTLGILASAFDEAWPFVAIRTHDDLNLVIKREHLANILLDLGIKGERNIETLKSLALKRLHEMDLVKVDRCTEQ